MKKIIICILLISGCTAEVSEKYPAEGSTVSGKTFAPFLGKYSSSTANMFKSFDFKVNNIVEVEVVPGHFEFFSYSMEGDNVKVHVDKKYDFEFKVKDDRTLACINGAQEKDLYIKSVPAGN